MSYGLDDREFKRMFTADSVGFSGMGFNPPRVELATGLADDADQHDQ